MGLIKFYRFDAARPDQEKGDQPEGSHARVCEFCINHKYDTALSDSLAEIYRQITALYPDDQETAQGTIQGTSRIKLLNRFGQEIPLGFKIRTDLDLYFDSL